jgi:N6-L-threonylcarbamoyladenine synthase
LGGGAVSDVILGIETSCDETAAAIVVRGTDVRSSVVSSQVDLHARYGGVVPEIASRAHVELLTPVIAQAVVEAGVEESSIEAVAATYGPGLVGSLLVGVSAAKSLALVWDVPFVAVNHLEAHVYAALVEDPSLELPVVVLMPRGRRSTRSPATSVSATRAVRPSTACRWMAIRRPSVSRGPC